MERDPATTTLLLLEAASREFIDRGFEAARVNEIARSVGVTAGAVYGRWPHKTDALVAALEYTSKRSSPNRNWGTWAARTRGPFDQLALLGTNLLLGVQPVQGRSHPGVRQRPQQRSHPGVPAEHLDEGADQLSRIVDEISRTGSSTAATALSPSPFCARRWESVRTC